MGAFGPIAKLKVIAAIAHPLMRRPVVLTPGTRSGPISPTVNTGANTGGGSTPGGPIITTGGKPTGGRLPTTGTRLPLPRPPVIAPPIITSPATPSPTVVIGTSQPSTVVDTDPFQDEDVPVVPSVTPAPPASPGINGKQIAIGVGLLAAAYYLFKKKP
jgi:hypothetical protein